MTFVNITYHHFTIYHHFTKKLHYEKNPGCAIAGGLILL